ncbi:MAG: hypothetical protein GF313_08635 [Caldithrix sp.]|nr:hypothetical protein [Caldithrix sp.]
MKFDSQTYRVETDNQLGFKILIAGIAALLLSAIGYFTHSKQFFFSYLVAYTFWVSIGLGGLFFVMLSHLTGTVWGIVLRRIIESIMMALPVMAIFFIPLIFGFHDLYHWSHAEAVAEDPLLQSKAPYLNVPFFIIRTGIYFGIWYLLARKLYALSLQQDEQPTNEQIVKMRRVSGPGMVLFAVTTAFASFDWIMSLDAHWYSTIFGVYFFAGSFLGALSFLVIVSAWLHNKDILTGTITIEHYHDLGRLIFAFVIFWGYMAFSQFFLIWYANIPEETIWYQHRWTGSWNIISLFLVIGNFLIPFVLLMPRAIKRNRNKMFVLAIWILVTHWVDLFWLITPNLHHHGAHFSWMDLTLFVGMGGIFVSLFWKYLTKGALVPVKDPKLQESIQFSNA